MMPDDERAKTYHDLHTVYNNIRNRRDSIKEVIERLNETGEYRENNKKWLQMSRENVKSLSNSSSWDTVIDDAEALLVVDQDKMKDSIEKYEHAMTLIRLEGERIYDNIDHMKVSPSHFQYINESIVVDGFAPRASKKTFPILQRWLLPIEEGPSTQECAIAIAYSQKLNKTMYQRCNAKYPWKVGEEYTTIKPWHVSKPDDGRFIVLAIALTESDIRPTGHHRFKKLLQRI